MNILNVLKTRYSTKIFDKTKKLTEEQISQLEDLLQFSPSSTNIQPWYFILTTTDEGKKRITNSTQGSYFFNEKKILDASEVIIFASQVDLTDELLNKVLEKEDADGRFLQK